MAIKFVHWKASKQIFALHGTAPNAGGVWMSLRAVLGGVEVIL
jgi:hypothetical protein